MSKHLPIGSRSRRNNKAAVPPDGPSVMQILARHEDDMHTLHKLDLMTTKSDVVLHMPLLRISMPVTAMLVV